MKILAVTDQRPEKLLEPLKNSNVHKIEKISIGNVNSGPLKYLYFIYHLALYDSDSLDVIVSNHPGRIGFLAVLYGTLARVPVVIKMGGDTWRGNKGMIRGHIHSRNLVKAASYLILYLLNLVVFRLADGYLPVSDEIANIVEQNTSCDGDSIETVRTFVDAGAYSSGRERCFRDRYDVSEKHLITTVTNLQFRGKYQGVVESIKTVRQVLRQRPDTAFAIAGSGLYLEQLRNEIDQIVASEDIRKRIYVTGHVSGIEDLYAATDVMIYFTHIDGYPSVISEAQAACVPVVANPKYGITEQITDGETGFLVVPDEPDTVASVITRLLDDCSLRRRIGEQANRKVVTQNNADAIGNELTTALDAILFHS